MTTDEALKLLEEMRRNCVTATGKVGGSYKDPKRYSKAEALSIAIRVMKESEFVPLDSNGEHPEWVNAPSVSK